MLNLRKDTPEHTSASTIRLATHSLPKEGAAWSVAPTTGAADALHLAECGNRALAEHRLLVVIAGNAPDVARLSEEIAWFAPQLRVAQLPDWETLPYDAFSPHQDLISERLATLWRLGRREVDVVVLAASTALQRLAPTGFLAAHAFEFTKGSALDAKGLRAQLVLAGYDHVAQVLKPGEYSVRGSLIDLFPMGSLLPYRIDLFDEAVASPRVRRSTEISVTESLRAALNTGCRFFSKQLRLFSNTCPRTLSWRYMAMSRRPHEVFGRTRRTGGASWPMIPNAHC